MLQVKHLKPAAVLAALKDHNGKNNRRPGLLLDTETSSLIITDCNCMFVFSVDCSGVEPSTALYQIPADHFKALLKSSSAADHVSIASSPNGYPALAIGSKQVDFLETTFDSVKSIISRAGSGSSFGFYDPYYTALLKKSIESFALDWRDITFYGGDENSALKAVYENVTCLICPLRVTRLKEEF